MDQKEASFLLGVSPEQLIAIIETGMVLPISKAQKKLGADKIANAYSISESQLDEFIAAFSAEDPGRNPPTAVRRELLIEANHRCGICRQPVPRLQFHHILGWEVVKHHDPKRMLTLCGTCHDQCGTGIIDKKSQDLYKTKLQTPHYLPDVHEEMKIKRARDLMQISSLLSQLPREFLDYFFDRTSSKYVPTPFQDYFWPNFIALLFSTKFHLYDNTAERLIRSFADPMYQLMDIAESWGHPTGPGNLITFSGMHNFASPEFHKDMDRFVLLNRDAYAAYKQLHVYLHENYFELDFDALDAAGLAAYEAQL